jgi:hypothetical protein
MAVEIRMSDKVLRITSKPGHFRAAENERIIVRRFSIRKQRSITTFDEEYWEQIRRANEALSVGLPSPPTVDWRPRLDLMTWANVDDEMTIVERVSGDLSLLRQLTTREVVGVEQYNLTAIIDSLLENEGMRDLLVDPPKNSASSWPGARPTRRPFGSTRAALDL